MIDKEVKSLIKKIRKLEKSKKDKIFDIEVLINTCKYKGDNLGYAKQAVTLIKKDKSTSKDKEVNNLYSNLKYFTTEDIEPSVAEQLIIDILNKYIIEYYREVSFDGCIAPSGYYYRFDFYIPSKNLVIEYDGKKWHQEGNTRDIEKNNFCHKHKIRIVRLNNKHYYNLGKYIKDLLKS